MYCIKCGKEINNNSTFCTYCGNQFGVTEGVENLVLPASLSKRFINLVIDSLARAALVFILSYISLLFFEENIVRIISSVFFFSYYLIFEALFQRTIGKMLTRTKVVGVDGNKPKFLSLLGRSLCRYIPFEAISFLFYGNYPTKGWHDRFSKTLVVSNNLTPEEIRNIDSEKILKSDKSNATATIIVVIIASIFFIAIIGILSSIILASLNVAREKGRDAEVSATLSNFKIKSEIYYDNNKSYSGFCNEENLELLSNDINLLCNDSESTYAITAPLSTGNYFCVDSVGSKKIDKRTLSQVSCSSEIGRKSFYDGEKTLAQMLEEEVNDFNQAFDLPQMIDSETSLDKIYIVNQNKLNYDLSLVNYDKYSDLEWSILRGYIEPDMIDMFCTSDEFKQMRSGGGYMVWNYYDKYKNFVGTIELSESNCN